MINEFKYVKPEKFDHLHLVYHFTVPLTALTAIKKFPYLFTLYKRFMRLP